MTNPRTAKPIRPRTAKPSRWAYRASRERRRFGGRPRPFGRRRVAPGPEVWAGARLDVRADRRVRAGLAARAGLAGPGADGGVSRGWEAAAGAGGVGGAGAAASFAASAAAMALGLSSA